MNDRELEFMQSILGYKFSLRRKTSDVTKRAVLKNTLTEQQTTDMDGLINTHVTDNTTNTSLISTISRLFDESKVLIEELQDLKSTSSSTSTPTPPSSNFISDTVCFSKLDFEDVNISDICKNIKFKKEGNRDVAYFGNTDYRYGRIVHRSCPYPDNPALDKVFDRMSRELNF